MRKKFNIRFNLVFFIILSTVICSCRLSRKPLIQEIDKKGAQNGDLNSKDILIIKGAPETWASETEIQIQVESDVFVSYRYKVSISLNNPCLNPNGYSESIEIDTPLKVDLNQLPDGDILVCAVGLYADGEWQSYSRASSVSWFKKTTGPAPVQFFEINEGNNKTILQWAGLLELEQQFLILRGSEPKELIILEDGKEYNINDETEGYKVIYQGTDLTLIDDNLENGKDYYYFIYIKDQYKLYSGSTLRSIKSLAMPWQWLPNGQPAGDYASAISAGLEFVSGQQVALYICRAKFTANDDMSPGQLVAGAGGDLSAGSCHGVGPDPISAIPGNQTRTNYEVLTITRGTFEDHFNWASVAYSATIPQTIPIGSLVAGKLNNQDLFICRGGFEGGGRPGNIAATFERCSASAWDGVDRILPTFNVWQTLTRKPLP